LLDALPIIIAAYLPLVIEVITEIHSARPVGHKAIGLLTPIQRRPRLTGRCAPTGSRTATLGNDPYSRPAAPLLGSAGKLDIVSNGKALLVCIIAHSQDRQLLTLIKAVQRPVSGEAFLGAAAGRNFAEGGFPIGGLQFEVDGFFPFPVIDPGEHRLIRLPVV